MNIDEREAKLGTGKHFAKLERPSTRKKSTQDTGASWMPHGGQKTSSKERLQKSGASWLPHHESAAQIVARLLEYENAASTGGPGNTGATYDSETLRQTIGYLMRTLGIGYEEARDIAMTHHHPEEGGAKAPMQSAEPEPQGERPPMPAQRETHCGRCGSRHHHTANCHLGGIPL